MQRLINIMAIILVVNCSISEKEEGKEKEIWKYYEGDSIEKCGNECLKMGIPSCAIYKKL